jgi:hypothetical protein
VDRSSGSFKGRLSVRMLGLGARQPAGRDRPDRSASRLQFPEVLGPQRVREQVEMTEEGVVTERLPCPEAARTRVFQASPRRVGRVGTPRTMPCQLTEGVANQAASRPRSSLPAVP